MSDDKDEIRFDAERTRIFNITAIFHIDHTAVVRVPEQRVHGFDSELGHLSCIFYAFPVQIKGTHICPVLDETVQ